MSSRPNGPPVAYAYITKTKGRKLALCKAGQAPHGPREPAETDPRFWFDELEMLAAPLSRGSLQARGGSSQGKDASHRWRSQYRLSAGDSPSSAGAVFE